MGFFDDNPNSGILDMDELVRGVERGVKVGMVFASGLGLLGMLAQRAAQARRVAQLEAELRRLQEEQGHE